MCPPCMQRYPCSLPYLLFGPESFLTIFPLKIHNVKVFYSRKSEELREEKLDSPISVDETILPLKMKGE